MKKLNTKKLGHMKKIIYLSLLSFLVVLFSCNVPNTSDKDTNGDNTQPVEPTPDPTIEKPALSISVIQAVSDDFNGEFVVSISITNNGNATANNISWYFNIYGSLEAPIGFNTTSLVVPPSSLGIGETTSFIVYGYAISYIPFYYLYQINCDDDSLKEVYNLFTII